MSQVSKEIIECPYCHKEGEYEHWTSINADLNPELREKIFSGELFVYRCPHCGNEFRVPAGTLYHDMKNKFMILFDFFKPDNYEYLPVEIPEGFALHNQYIFRSVFGLQQFREKILVLEEGLDEDGKPKQVFQGVFSWEPGISLENYIQVATEFLDFCEPFIDKRADKIIEKLELIINNE